MKMPGLSELSRAPLSPQVMLSAWTRRMLARFASAYAPPELVTWSGCRNGMPTRSAAGVLAKAWFSSAGSGGSMWPAWLAITMPGAAGCDHATQGFEDVRGADQVDGGDRLPGGLRRGQPRGVDHVHDWAELGGGAGGEGVDGGSVGDVDVGCLGGKARGLPLRNGKVESNRLNLVRRGLFHACSWRWPVAARRPAAHLLLP
jgi:hypothetical protein